MNEQEKEKVMAGIAGYKHEQQVIKRVLRRHKKLSAKEFDRIFGDSSIWIDPKTGTSYLKTPRPKIRFICVDGKAVLLGDVFGMGYWSRWLHLTQIMTVLGIIGITLENDEITYRLK